MKNMGKANNHRLDEFFPNLKRNIFIITYGRSGSTLLQNVLNTIPRCVIKGENHNMMELIWKAVLRSRQAKHVWGKQRLCSNHPWYGSDEIKPMIFANGMIDSFIKNVLCPPQDCQYFGFKEIRYNVYGENLSDFLDFMRSHYKDAFFIFNTRNAEAVSNSAWWKNWNHDDVVTLVEQMNKRFNDYNLRHPEFTAILSYEEFCSDLSVFRQLFEQIQVPYNENAIKEVMSERLQH